jgi:hypothetical protein
MHIRKYDFDWTRRAFMEKTAAVTATSGLLTELWPRQVESGDYDAVYPDELYDIEAYTKGNVKLGDVINKDNIDLVQDLVDPFLYQEVTQDGREFWIGPSLTETEKHFPPYYLDATIRNDGMAAFGPDGNTYTKDGKPWIGGHPFPNPKDGRELVANLSLAWGRHDRTMFAIPTVCLDREGSIEYLYDFVWCEQQCTGLVNPRIAQGSPYLPGYEDKIRLQSVWFTYSNDVKGTAFMTVWGYDQNKFPDTFGYLPAFKRVRRFPTNQRFEPLVAGMNLFLTDAWGFGDPMLTWGNFEIIHRGPYLGSVHNQWRPERENWSHPVSGGGQGNTYYYANRSLIPECIVWQGEPTGFPRAPVSKRRLWLDARNLMTIQAISDDRRGDIWKSFEIGQSYREVQDPSVGLPLAPGKGTYTFNADDGRPEWSWAWVVSNDIQSGRITRYYHGLECRGGYRVALDADEDYLNKYMTVQAMRRIGT